MEISHIITESNPEFFDADMLLFRAEWDGRCVYRAVDKELVDTLGEPFIKKIWHDLDIRVAKPIFRHVK